MTTSNIMRRIVSLEIRTRKHRLKPPSHRDIEILREFLIRLVPTMASEHLPLLKTCLLDPQRGRHTFGPGKGPISRGLARTFNDMWYSVSQGSKRAIALPPTIVEVYLKDPKAFPSHDCSDCGLLVPSGYFPECPLCGGRTGWCAFKIKNKAPGFERLTPYDSRRLPQRKD